ncbi:MAG: hypothetical protein Q4F67_08170, partial [Propionibacteriaceae bacterium]|nr:hypothetical protein [Propionibacteriaceae bacterium]
MGEIGHGIAVAVVLWWARRRGIAHTTTADPRVFRRRPRCRPPVPARRTPPGPQPDPGYAPAPQT